MSKIVEDYGKIMATARKLRRKTIKKYISDTENSGLFTATPGLGFEQIDIVLDDPKNKHRANHNSNQNKIKTSDEITMTTGTAEPKLEYYLDRFLRFR